MAFTSDATGNTDALVTDLLKRLQGSSDRLAANVIPFRQRQQAVEDKIQAIQPPPEPDLVPVKTVSPDPQVTNIFKAMGPDLMAFAAIGGALTGAPITATLNNATGFLKGLHEGDAEVTRDHLDKFKTELSAANEHNNAAIEKYKAAFENKKFTMQQLQSELTSIANEYGDPIAMHAIETGDLREVGNLLNARESIKARIQQHQDMLDLRVDSAWGSVADLTLKDGTRVQGSRNKITGAWQDLAGKAIDPSSIAREDRQALPARSAPALALQKFIQDNPNATPERIMKFASTYAERVKAARDFGTGPLGNQTRSFSVGLYHLDTLQQLSDALKNGNIQAFNRIAQKWSAETGDPAPTNFDTAKQIIGAEVVKAIVGAGGGGVQERLEAANHIGTALSPDQLAGAIDTTKDLMVGQLKGLEAQYRRTTGENDFTTQFLSPEAQRMFKEKAPNTGGDQYRTPDDVLKAYDNGEIKSADEAKQILIERFGYQEK